MQMNTAKWPFSIDEDALHVIVDVALPRFLDSAAVHMHAYARHMQCMCPHATYLHRGIWAVRCTVHMDTWI